MSIKDESELKNLYFSALKYHKNKIFNLEWLAFLKRQGTLAEFKLLLDWATILRDIKDLNVKCTFGEYLFHKENFEKSANKEEFESLRQYIILYILEVLNYCNYSHLGGSDCHKIFFLHKEYPNLGMKNIYESIKLLENAKQPTWKELKENLIEPAVVQQELYKMAKMRLPEDYKANMSEVINFYYNRYKPWWSYIDYINLYIFSLNNKGSLLDITCIKETLSAKKIKLTVNDYIDFYDYYKKVHSIKKCKSYYYIFKHYEETKGNLDFDFEKFWNKCEVDVKKNPRIYVNKGTIKQSLWILEQVKKRQKW
jgi:hypothetical protein